MAGLADLPVVVDADDRHPVRDGGPLGAEALQQGPPVDVVDGEHAHRPSRRGGHAGRFVGILRQTLATGAGFRHRLFEAAPALHRPALALQEAGPLGEVAEEPEATLQQRFSRQGPDRVLVAEDAVEGDPRQVHGPPVDADGHHEGSPRRVGPEVGLVVELTDQPIGEAPWLGVRPHRRHVQEPAPGDVVLLQEGVDPVDDPPPVLARAAHHQRHPVLRRPPAAGASGWWGSGQSVLRERVGGRKGARRAARRRRKQPWNRPRLLSIRRTGGTADPGSWRGHRLTAGHGSASRGSTPRRSAMWPRDRERSRLLGKHRQPLHPPAGVARSVLNGSPQSAWGNVAFAPAVAPVGRLHRAASTRGPGRRARRRPNHWILPPLGDTGGEAQRHSSRFQAPAMRFCSAGKARSCRTRAGQGLPPG